jgi:hypothetical protein
MSDEPRFEFIDAEKDERTGYVKMRYGTGPDDPQPFILTLTPQYAARQLGRALHALTSSDMTVYAAQLANELEFKASFEKSRGFTTLTLE